MCTHRITHDIFRNHFACVLRQMDSPQNWFYSSLMQFWIVLLCQLGRHRIVNFSFIFLWRKASSRHSPEIKNKKRLVLREERTANTSNLSNVIIVLWIASLEIHSRRRGCVKAVRSVLVIPIRTGGTIAIATIVPFPGQMPSNEFLVARSNCTNSTRTRSRCYFSNANVAAAAGGATAAPRMRRFTAGSYGNSFTWRCTRCLMHVPMNEHIFFGRKIAVQRCVGRRLRCNGGRGGCAWVSRALWMICWIIGARNTFRRWAFAIQLGVFNGTHYRRCHTAARDIHFAHRFGGHNFLIGMHSRMVLTGMRILWITGWWCVARFDVMTNIHSNIGWQWQIGWPRRWLWRRTQFHVDAWTLFVRFAFAFLLQSFLECVHIDGECTTVRFIHIHFDRWLLARRPNLLVIRHFISQTLMRWRRRFFDWCRRCRCRRRRRRLGWQCFARRPSNHTDRIDGLLILFRIHITISITSMPALALQFASILDLSIRYIFHRRDTTIASNQYTEKSIRFVLFHTKKR